MSYYRTYSDYLGQNRCCLLKGTGSEGPPGPTGPAGIGPVGPAGVKTSITTLFYSSNSITIPNQYTPIAYYSVTLNGGNEISTINFNIFPEGHTAIIFINGIIGTSDNPCIINNTITNVVTNLSSSLNLEKGSGNQGNAIMNISNSGFVNFCNITGYYN